MRKLPPVIKVCVTCGKLFSVQPYRAETAKCCSTICRQAHNARVSAEHRAAMQRDRGDCVSYRKLRGRHEHRVVAEAMLGRDLFPGEIVHHIDGNKRNNNPSNLIVMQQSEHASKHFPMMLQRRKEVAGY